MSAQNLSQTQAILAAKKGNWQEAVRLNLEYLEKQPASHAGYNRLGVAYLQLGDARQATAAFKQALSIDKNNPIAKKNLKKAQSLDSYIPPSFTQPHFIEEPGKTKVVELHRLADKGCLNSFPTGAPCILRCKKRYISVEVGTRYIGALPEDISFRLSRLIERGNQYQCYLYETSNKSCSVYIKEIFKSKKNQDTTSFPVSHAETNSENSDSLLLSGDIYQDTAVAEKDSEESEEITENLGID